MFHHGYCLGDDQRVLPWIYVYIYIHIIWIYGYITMIYGYIYKYTMDIKFNGSTMGTDFFAGHSAEERKLLSRSLIVDEVVGPQNRKRRKFFWRKSS